MKNIPVTSGKVEKWKSGKLRLCVRSWLRGLVLLATAGGWVG